MLRSRAFFHPAPDIVRSRSTTWLRQRLDSSAERFDEHAFLPGVTRDGLFERLAPMTIPAKQVIDLGTATGLGMAALKSRFPGAAVHGVDLSLGMLRRHEGSWFRKPSLVQARAEALPFRDDSIDVVFANLLLPFVDDPASVMVEVARVLKKDGVFAFASLGPDTFRELREAWRTVDDGVHVAEFPDMHDVGDAIVRAGLCDPVLDVDRVKVSYSSPESLFADLTYTGARNVLDGRLRGLMSRERLDRFQKSLFGNENSLTLEVELVYGHAFGGEPMQARGPIAIDPGSIGRRGAE